jgi:hypothetical protein
MLDCYLAVERAELLDGEQGDALWINVRGGGWPSTLPESGSGNAPWCAMVSA